MIEKSWTLHQKGVAGLVGLIIAVGFISYTMGAVLSSTTSTIASTTSTDIRVTTIMNSSTVSFTVTSYVIQTTTKLLTITDTGPDQVLISGRASSRMTGTFATDILFVLATNNATVYDAKIVSGQYSQQLPQHAFYNVYIKYGTSLSNVGAGQCSAGALPTWFGNTVPTFDWIC